MAGKDLALRDVPADKRWELRTALLKLQRQAGDPRLEKADPKLRDQLKGLAHAIEFVPTWVVVCVALALGVGTCIGYKRIVVTVAEKIGKTHLTYAQGAAAEVVAAATILLADAAHMPVSTTHILSSGVAGTMAANGSGIQGSTVGKIALAWVLTLPAATLLAGVLFAFGRLVSGLFGG